MANVLKEDLSKLNKAFLRGPCSVFFFKKKHCRRGVRRIKAILFGEGGVSEVCPQREKQQRFGKP